MTRLIILFAIAAGLALGGCVDDGLIAPQTADAATAPYSPDPAGHLPQQRKQNPGGDGAPRF